MHRRFRLRFLAVTLFVALSVAVVAGAAVVSRGEAQQSCSPDPVICSARVLGTPVYHPSLGDLWMNTWMGDDKVYTTWGDGTGYDTLFPEYFPVLTPAKPRTPGPGGFIPDDFPVGLFCNINVCDGLTPYPPGLLTDAGVAALEGPPPFSFGINIALDAPEATPFFETGVDLETRRNDKPSSLLAVGSRIYLAGHGPAGIPDNGYIAYSDNFGGTWTEVPGSPGWTGNSRFRVMMFVNMGPSYALNTDGFIYALAMGTEASWSTAPTPEGHPDSENMTVYLARVPVTMIDNGYGNWEYLVDVAPNGTPSWTGIESSAQPLPGIESSMQGSAMYHEFTDRYIFMTARPAALFAAAEPWGPWTKIADLCFEPGCPGVSVDPSWQDGKYIPGVISKGAGPSHFFFTIAGGHDHYQLQVGLMELQLAGVGGEAELREADGRQQNATDESGWSAGVLAGVIAVVAIGVVALVGAAWRLKRPPA